MILDDKVKAFGAEECVEKLIEELNEALIEAINLSDSLKKNDKKESVDMCIKKLMEELADVDVAGIKTFSRLYRKATYWYTGKLYYALTTQIPKAIEEKLKLVFDTCLEPLPQRSLR